MFSKKNTRWLRPWPVQLTQKSRPDLYLQSLLSVCSRKTIRSHNPISLSELPLSYFSHRTPSPLWQRYRRPFWASSGKREVGEIRVWRPWVARTYLIPLRCLTMLRFVGLRPTCVMYVRGCLVVRWDGYQGLCKWSCCAHGSSRRSEHCHQKLPRVKHSTKRRWEHKSEQPLTGTGRSATGTWYHSRPGFR